MEKIALDALPRTMTGLNKHSQGQNIMSLKSVH